MICYVNYEVCLSHFQVLKPGTSHDTGLDVNNKSFHWDHLHFILHGLFFPTFSISPTSWSQNETPSTPQPEAEISQWSLKMRLLLSGHVSAKLHASCGLRARLSIWRNVPLNLNKSVPCVRGWWGGKWRNCFRVPDVSHVDPPPWQQHQMTCRPVAK
jgi:hypothetical protein